MKFAHLLHIVGHVDTETESDDVEQVSENLDSSMEPDKAREAQKTDRDGAEWENDSERKTSQDTVSNEHVRLSIASSLSAERVAGTVLAAANKHVASRARSWCGILSLELVVSTIAIVVITTGPRWTTGWPNTRGERRTASWL